MDSRYLLLVLMSSFALLAFGCQDSGSGGGDDDTYGEDDDDVADDDDVSSDDDDNVGDDDDNVGDDDDNVGDDDDNVGDDDDNVGDDDDTVGDDDVSTSCNEWDPIDLPSASWTYTSYYQFSYDGNVVDDTGTEVVSPGASTTFEGNTVFPREGAFTGSQAMNWWGYDQCGADGNVDYGSYLVDAGAMGSVTTVNDIGVLYLPYDPDTMVGHSWNTNYTQTVALEGGGESDETSYNVNWHWEVVGMESVTVPAGTFTAAHIHADYTSEDQIGEHGGTLDTYWVEGLGLVKWDEQRAAEGGQYILRELESYSGPLSP